jgi:hypothetical protein
MPLAGIEHSSSKRAATVPGYIFREFSKISDIYKRQ